MQTKKKLRKLFIILILIIATMSIYYKVNIDAIKTLATSGANLNMPEQNGGICVPLAFNSIDSYNFFI